MRKSLGIIVIGAAVAWPAPASADSGPNTCLNGFVWRGAFAGDAVCVTPAGRAQAAADNAAAAGRIDPNAGSGPRGCKTGFVWRAARPSDLVCVTPPIRAQTSADNAAAAQRRNSMAMTLSRWVGNGAFKHRIVVTNVNVGEAWIGLYRSSDRRLIKGWRATSRPLSGRPGGQVAYRTSQLVCNGAPNAYFRAKDQTSGRWSERKFVRTGCVQID